MRLRKVKNIFILFIIKINLKKNFLEAESIDITIIEMKSKAGSVQSFDKNLPLNVNLLKWIFPKCHNFNNNNHQYDYYY